MKSLYKKLSIITVMLFLAGIVGVTYYLYKTSANIAHSLQIRELSQIELLEQALKPVSVAVGVEFFLGVSAILLLLLKKQERDTSTENNEQLESNSDFTVAADTTFTARRVALIQSSIQAVYPDSRSRFEKVLNNICNELEACQGAIFHARQQDGKRFVEMCASYAYFIAESKAVSYEFGEGLTGQVAKEGKLINISTVPEGYVTIISGLGNSSPKHLVIAPVKFENIVVGVIEIASFKPFTKPDEEFINELSPVLGKLLATQHQEEAIVSL
jgi:GAF domain-containing protein